MRPCPLPSPFVCQLSFGGGAGMVCGKQGYGEIKALENLCFYRCIFIKELLQTQMDSRAEVRFHANMADTCLLI